MDLFFRLYGGSADIKTVTENILVFSKNKRLALSGSPSEGEGIFVLIGYGILFFGAMNYFCYEETLRIFEKAMLVL